jgi:benzoylformate decarboxylase
MRAYATTLQPPAGPVYVSIPLDDWDQPVLGETVVRSVSSRYAPDPDWLTKSSRKEFARANRPRLIYGPEVDRSGSWEPESNFAEQLRAPVFLAPLAERTSFAQNRPQFQGMLAMAKGCS